MGRITVVVPASTDELSPEEAANASITIHNSIPWIVRLWRAWFDAFFLSFRYLLGLSIVVNILRGVLPQDAALMNSYASFVQHSSEGLARWRAGLWVIRDSMLLFQVLIVLLSILLRWAASQTSYVRNRTKMITSGQDILGSFMISLACSAIFFTASALFGLALVAPVYWHDWQRHRHVFLSFWAVEKIETVDVMLIFVHFFLGLLTVAEHLSRREVVAEGVLLQSTQSWARLTLQLFRAKRLASMLAAFSFVVLFLLKKDEHTKMTVRVVSVVCSSAVLALHLAAGLAATLLLFQIVSATPKDLQVSFKRASFLLKWVECEKGEKDPGVAKRFLKQVVPLLLWHVSGRTFAAQVSMLIALCNWLPLVPRQQVGLFTLFMLANAASLFVFRLLFLMNPACVNERGDDIPAVHLGFGMLVLRVQLMHLAEGSALKMIPATIERLFEAVTISYRWEPRTHMPVQLVVWSRAEKPYSFHTIRRSVLLRAWDLMRPSGINQHDHTLIWLDQASIDQESTNMKALLVPKMTACYALSFATLVLDNSSTHAMGTDDNYFSRTWTFQEFCLPPLLIVLSFNSSQDRGGIQGQGADRVPDAVLRARIQQRFWVGAKGWGCSAGSARAAQGDGKGIQEFLVMWLDEEERILKLLLDQPQIIHEYVEVAGKRQAYTSEDRFAAIMQALSGVMCFTQEAVEQLKGLVIKAMARAPEKYVGCPIIDNRGWTGELSGSAHRSRLLAGPPCPGDKHESSSLLLHVTGGEVAGDVAGQGRSRSVSLSAVFDPYEGLGAAGSAGQANPAMTDALEPAPVPVRAVLDTGQNIVQQLVVEPSSNRSSGVASSEEVQVPTGLVRAQRQASVASAGSVELALPDVLEALGHESGPVFHEPSTWNIRLA